MGVVMMETQKISELELIDLAEIAARKIRSSGVGCMHSMWDFVFDARAIHDGNSSLLPESVVRDELVKFCSHEGGAIVGPDEAEKS
jgi:hypothetical protein